MMKLRFLFLILFAIFFSACEKEESLVTNPNKVLNFAQDSIFFDTVFTSVGSTSRRLKVRNQNDKAILISQIKLRGGISSPYSLNINGIAANEVQDLKINGKDSINLFIKVNINPSDKRMPFIVKDSIEFMYNGQKKIIPLIAFGQNANFITNGTISQSATWDKTIPYVIYNSLTIPEGKVLTIGAGTKVLFHSNSTLHIKGSLIVAGTKAEQVVFSSDRLENIYSEEPGQWNGLHFYPKSKDSKLNYALIKNAVVGITCDSLSMNSQPKLILSNSTVKNMEVAGFLGYQTDFAAFNNLFYNCGQYLVYGIGGGNYNIKQNTLVGFNPQYARKTPATYFSDFVSSTQADNLNLDIQNNIIWGNLNNEFIVEKKTSFTSIVAIVKNNLLKSTDGQLATSGNLLNLDPAFINPYQGNFFILKSSPAINKGINLSADRFFEANLKLDVNGNQRLFPSDLGCYENN